MPVDNPTLEKFCQEMDKKISSNNLLRGILNYHALPLQEMLKNQKEQIARSNTIQLPKKPGEDSAQWHNRLNAAIENQAIAAINPSIQQHEQLYRNLRNSSALAYGNSNDNYKAAVMQVAQQTKYTPEFIHAYVCYRQDLLMQAFAKEHAGISQDYNSTFREGFERLGIAKQVETMAAREKAAKDLTDIVNQNKELRDYVNIPIVTVKEAGNEALARKQNEETYKNALNTYPQTHEHEAYKLSIGNELSTNNEQNSYEVEMVKDWMRYMRIQRLTQLQALVDPDGSKYPIPSYYKRDEKWRNDLLDRASSYQEKSKKEKAEAKRKAEEEAKQTQKAEEEAKQKAEAEAKRKAEEAEAKRKAEEAAAKQKAEEAEAKRKAEEAAAKRKAEAAAKREAEKEAKRKAEEEKSGRLKRKQSGRLRSRRRQKSKPRRT